MPVDIYSENKLLDDENNVPEQSTKLDQAIKKIIEREGFITYEIDKNLVSTNGGNYLGTLYEIDVKGQTKGGVDKELNIFIKTITPGVKDLEVLSVPNVYMTELFTYKELSKLINELQEEINVPVNERYKMVKCYDETDTEMIIMENISKKGFTTFHRLDVVILKFAEIAFQDLAKFHALSYVMKEKRPEYFETRIKTIKAPFIIGESWQKFDQCMCNLFIDHFDEDVKERVEKFCVGVADRFGGNFNDEMFKRCLCHGDYKPSNILTKVIDGEISEIIPVDYQLLNFGSPIFDILYFIVTCTDREFRKAHLSHLKDLYHETLTKFLRYFDIDVDLVYSREDFDKDYKEKLDHGLMYSLIFLPLVFAAEDDVLDATKADVKELSFKVDDKFKDRIRGIIEDYIEWGIV